MDIVEPSFGSWRGVTVDNFFMSAALTEELFKKMHEKEQHNELQQTRSHRNFFRSPEGKRFEALLG
jgi:hypothetical protein